MACGHTEHHPAASGALWAREKCEPCRWADDERDRREERQQRKARRQAGAGVPEQYHGTRLRDLEGWPPDLLFHCNQWVQNGGGLYIYGPVGVGKSSAAAAAAWELLDRRGVEWVTTSRLGRWVRAEYGSPELAAVNRLAGVGGALVLDDFGEEPTGEDIAAAIKDTINTRIDTRSPLIVTSNLDPAEACERDEKAALHLGQRLASRIRGYCTVVRVDGHDHRLDR